MHVRELLAILVRGEALTQSQAEQFFEELLGGLLEPAQVGAGLALVQARGPSVDELVGAARVMRRHVLPLPIDHAHFARAGIALMDTCGTGGTPKTFNVGTLSAIVSAAAAPGRVALAKHGNRSRTGRGSAEVLAGLGVNVDASPVVQARCLRELGVCFCYAIHHHPAMRHVASVRQALGFPTLFNALGPLTNPAGATHQVLGVYDESLRDRMGQALAQLRCERAWVLRSEDGLDELSLAAPTRVCDVIRDASGARTTRELVIDPRRLGLREVPSASLAAMDLPDAVRIGRELLEGAPGPRRDMLVLNAGAALVVGGVAPDMARGMDMASDALDRGEARALLGELIRLTQGG